MSELWSVDCQRCGLCCAPPKGFSISVPLWAEDRSPVPESELHPGFVCHAERTTLKLEGKEVVPVGVLGRQQFVLSAEKPCPQFRREGDRCSCSVYDQRPMNCRQFAPMSEWSPACRRLRMAAGIDDRHEV